MQDSGIPPKFPIRWGASAAGSFIRPIPVLSQTGITPGAASLTDGYPPLCATPVAAGGIPPFMQDMNGILNQITAWQQWMQAGGPIAYDPTFQASIGGYPKGAIVQSVTNFGVLWLCTADNNTANPDTGGAGWTSLFRNRGAGSFTINGSLGPIGTSPWTVPPGVFSVRARGWGAGGGGGGAVNSGCAGVGGGAGGYFEGIYAVTPGQVISVTAGPGGSPGGAGGGQGGNGGATSFGAFATAFGGGGGAPGLNGISFQPSGGGGSLGGNILNIFGGGGAIGFLAPSATSIAAGAGAAPFGGSVTSSPVISGGQNGCLFGGGASGASTTAAGGTGGAGCCLLDWG